MTTSTLLEGGKLNLADAEQEPAGKEVSAAAQEFALPEFPNELLPDILRRLTRSERHRALTQNILPVAWLPRLTLYAKVGSGKVRTQVGEPLRIIAAVPRRKLLNAARLVLGSRLRLEASAGLYRKSPEFSAKVRLNTAQIFMTAVAGLCLALGCFVLPVDDFILALAVLFNLFFLLTLSLRLLWLVSGPARKRQNFPTPDDEQLPVYTVLVPVFREIRVLPQLIRSLRALNYPVAKLDIKLVLEESDTAMQRALARVSLPGHFEIIVVPAGKPQTKPRALAYALQFARGELLTVYDAEDIPEPAQLHKAAQTFAASGPDLACLQAELAFYNPNENWLTRGIMARRPQAV